MRTSQEPSDGCGEGEIDNGGRPRVPGKATHRIVKHVPLAMPALRKIPPVADSGDALGDGCNTEVPGDPFASQSAVLFDDSPVLPYTAVSNDLLPIVLCIGRSDGHFTSPAKMYCPQ